MAAHTSKLKVTLEHRIDILSTNPVAEDPPISIDMLNSPRNGSPSPSEHAPPPAPVIPNGPIMTSSTESACRRLIQFALERPSLIEAILSSKDEEEVTRSLPLGDAQIFVNTIDEALNSSDLSPPVRKETIGLLYKTCEHHAIVPSRLTVRADYDRTSDALYKGGYADVWKSQHSGRDVAVKAIRLYSKHVSRKVINKFCKLVVTWRSLQNPSLVPLIGVIMSETRIAMVSHWMANGNINEFIKANPEADRLELLVDTAEGLIYLHNNGIIHGDLKGLNVLIDETCHARLADFGLLTIVSDPAHLISPSSHGQSGTMRWMSPELIAPEKFGLNKSCPTKSSDCYALGMVIYETISGGIPFHECIETVVYMKVTLGEHPSRCAVFPDDLWKMTELCWAFQPDDRPSIIDVLRCLRTVLNSQESPPWPGGDMDTHRNDRCLSNGSSTVQSGKRDATTAERSVHIPGSSCAADRQLGLVSSPPQPHQPARDSSALSQPHSIPHHDLRQHPHPQVPRQTIHQGQMANATMRQDCAHDYPSGHDPNPPTSYSGSPESNEVHTANFSNNQTFNRQAASPKLVTPHEVSVNRWTRGSPVDEQQNVERKVTALLNKLSMEKFDSISDQIIAWANKSEMEKDGRTLIHVVRLIFDKATDDVPRSEVYARLCRKTMEKISPNVQDYGILNAEGKPVAGGQLFRKYLLDRCQEDFERGWTTNDAAVQKATETSGEAMPCLDESYATREAKRRGLGLIQFIGELYKMQMLTERIMHECIKMLLGNFDDPKEEEIESLCRLLTTIGKLFDNPKVRAHMDIYFARIEKLGKISNATPRMQFMLQDIIELRQRKWVPRIQVFGPTTIAEVKQEVAKQRAQAEKEAGDRSVALSRGGPRRGRDRGRGRVGEQNAGGWSVAVMGPSSIWPGKKDAAKRDSTLTRLNSSSSGTAEPQRKKLQLLPRSKPVEEKNKVTGDTADRSEVGSGDETPQAMSEGKANKRIAENIKEFFLLRNIDESEGYFTKLLPSYHHLLVDKMVFKAIGSGEADGKLVADAFTRAAEKNLCSMSAFEEGFLPVAELLDNIAIDSPKAFQIVAITMKGAGLDKDEERRSRIARKSMDGDKLLELLA